MHNVIVGAIIGAYLANTWHTYKVLRVIARLKSDSSTSVEELERQLAVLDVLKEVL